MSVFDQQKSCQIVFTANYYIWLYEKIKLRKKCPYLELFLSTSSHIRTEYGEIRSICPYSVRIRENADQNNSEYGHILRSDQANKIWWKMGRVKVKVKIDYWDNGIKS